MTRSQIQAVSAKSFIAKDEAVVVIEYEDLNLYEYDVLHKEIKTTKFITTLDSCDLLRLQLGSNNVKLLLVHFHANPIEGCYIIQLFRVLRPQTPVVVILDDNYWQEEAEQAENFGFVAGLVNPVTTEKWQRLCNHLACDNSKFVVIE